MNITWVLRKSLERTPLFAREKRTEQFTYL